MNMCNLNKEGIIHIPISLEDYFKAGKIQRETNKALLLQIKEKDEEARNILRSRLDVRNSKEKGNNLKMIG